MTSKIERRNNVLTPTRCVVITPADSVAQEVLDVAIRKGTEIVHLDPSRKDIEAKLRHYQPQVLIITRLLQLRDLPEELWADRIIVINDVDDNDPDELLLSALLSPLISKDNQLLFWSRGGK